MATTFTRNRPIGVRLPRFGITAFTSRHGSSFRMGWASHPYHKIVVVVDGRGVLETAGGRVELIEADAVRVPNGRPHRFVDYAGTAMTLCVLCIADPATLELPLKLWPQALRAIGSDRATRIGVAEAAEMRRVARRIAIEAEADEPHAGAVAIALSTQWLVRLLRSVPGPRPSGIGRHAAFEATLRWLDEHYTEPVRVDDLAMRAGLSYRAYTTAFRARTGTSVVQRVTARRLALADRLIGETGDIVTSAFEAGFGDLSHFYRVYVRANGRSPGAGRRTDAAGKSRGAVR